MKWDGPAGKGAMKKHKAQKRAEAEARNFKDKSAEKLLTEIFTEPEANDE